MGDGGAQQAARRREGSLGQPKIAIVGAGSVGFTRKLIADIVSVPELCGAEFALTDVSAHNLELVQRIIERMIEVNRLPAKVTATTDRRRAFEGARYVISCVRVGGIEAYADDIRIPLKYGVDQCVGDTICAGGLLYGQRNAPVILDFCRDIREVAEADALFLNYANPMAINTWVALEHGKVRTVGLCHGVQHGAAQIADALGAEKRADLEYVCAGINHQTWFVDLRLKGRRIGREELLAAFERHPVFSKQEKVRIDVLKRFGVYSTESNGHLSEYLPWYRKRPDEIARWIDMSDWIHGETGGYLRHVTETRNWFETEYPTFLEEAGEPLDPAKRSSEHASHILEALETGRVYRGHFNVRNGGRDRQPSGGRDRRGARLRRSLRRSTWYRESCCRKLARRPATSASTCSGWRRARRSRATSISSSSRFSMTRSSGPSARRTRSGRWSTKCLSPKLAGCRNMPTPSPRRGSASLTRR